MDTESKDAHKKDVSSDKQSSYSRVCMYACMHECLCSFMLIWYMMILRYRAGGIRLLESSELLLS